MHIGISYLLKWSVHGNATLFLQNGELVINIYFGGVTFGVLWISLCGIQEMIIDKPELPPLNVVYLRSDNL